MKILHIASFQGNIGDNASHIGLRFILDQFFPRYHMETLEIRRFYKQYQGGDKRFFDQDFVDFANKFDLLLIGGGGFLDYWVPNSHTGTTLDIPLTLLNKLSVKTLICSIGSKPHKDIPDGNIEKYREFLSLCHEKDNINIAFRNDGSIETVSHDIGKRYTADIPEILDNGFFYQMTAKHNAFPIKHYVAINITADQILMKNQEQGPIDVDLYYQKLCHVITNIIEDKRLNVVLVPHIYSDLNAITKLQSLLPDQYMRNSLFVAPCVQGDAGTDYIFSIYKNAKAVLATRLHANICNLALGCPVVGLVALDRVKYLYSFLNADHQAVSLNGEFVAPVIKALENTLDNHSDTYLAIENKICKQKEKSLRVYGSILKG